MRINITSKIRQDEATVSSFIDPRTAWFLPSPLSGTMHLLLRSHDMSVRNLCTVNPSATIALSYERSEGPVSTVFAGKAHVAVKHSYVSFRRKGYRQSSIYEGANVHFIKGHAHTYSNLDSSLRGKQRVMHTASKHGKNSMARPKDLAQ